MKKFTTLIKHLAMIIAIMFFGLQTYAQTKAVSPSVVKSDGYFYLNGSATKTIMKGVEEERSTLTNAQCDSLAHRLQSSGVNLIVVYYDPSRNYRQTDYFYQCMQDHGIWIAQHFGTLKKEVGGSFDNVGGVLGVTPDEAWIQARLVDLQSVINQCAHHSNILFWWLGGEFVHPSPLVTYDQNIIRSHIQRYRDRLTTLDINFGTRRPFTVSHHFLEFGSLPVARFFNYGNDANGVPLTDFTWITAASHFHNGDVGLPSPTWGAIIPEVTEDLLLNPYLNAAVSANGNKPIFMGGWFGDAHTLMICEASNQYNRMFEKWEHLYNIKYNGYSVYHVDEWAGNAMPHALYKWNGAKCDMTEAGKALKEINTKKILFSSPAPGDVLVNGTSYVAKIINNGITATITKVEYYVDGVLAGTSTSAPWSINFTAGSAKSVNCVLTAKAYDNNSQTHETSITTIRGVPSYYNKLNVGGSVGVIDPKDGHTANCVLTSIQVIGGYRYVNLSVDGLNHQVKAGNMMKVNNGNSGLFIYPATIFDATERFSEIMIAPYQYPSVDILYPAPGQSVGISVVRVTTNYPGKNVPWNGIGNAPTNTELLKTLTFNGSAGQTAEAYTWNPGGSAGSRTMTVNMTDKLGATVTKSLTVNYDPSIPLYAYYGPYGDYYKELKIRGFTAGGEPCAEIYLCNRPGYATCDGGDFSHDLPAYNIDQEINKYADVIAYHVTQWSTPPGVQVYVVNKNQYNSESFPSSFGYGTITYKKLYDAVAARLGKDSQGKWRVWASTSATTRSPLDALPCLNMSVLGAPGYSNVSSNTITVNWTEVTGEAGHQVQRSSDGSTWANIGPQHNPGVSNYADASLSPNTRYYYRVITKGCAPCGDVASLSSYAYTANTDGIVNGYFDDPSGVGWSGGGCNRLGYGSALATDGPYSGSYYGRAHANNCAQNSCGSLKQTITVPSDAGELKYAVKAFAQYNSAATDVSLVFGGVLIENYPGPSSTPWVEHSYAIPTSLRGQAVTLELKANNHFFIYCGDPPIYIGIDNVRITNVDVPTVTVSAPATVNTDAVTTITATASDLGGINRVEFFANGDCIGQDFTSPYACAWTPAVAKTYTLMAKAYDKRGATNTATKTVTATGIVGYWKLDASMGTVAMDNSGNDNQGTLKNGPVWTTAGKVGGALGFDGTNDYVNCGNGSSLNITGKITIAAWIKPGKMATQRVIQKGVQGSNNGYELSLSSTGTIFVRFNQKTSGDTYKLSSTALYPATGNTWMHVAATFDGSTIKLYVNGVQNGGSKAMAVPIGTNTSPLTIGATSGGVNNFYKGTIDDARIYNRALTATEILAQYQAGTMAAYWKLDESTGATTASDASGNNNIGTLNGPVWTTAGKVGGALGFDGTNDYVNCGNGSSLNITGKITIAAWIKPGKMATQRVIQKGVQGSNNGYELSLSSTGTIFVRFNQKTSGDTYKLSSTALYPATGNTWMHVAATFDGSTIKLYVNGVQNGGSKAMAVPIGTNTSPLTIGATSGGINNFYKGTIDDARIYDRALTATEILALYNAGKSATEVTDTTGVTDVAEPVVQDNSFNLKTYPNPFSSSVTIEYSLPKAGNVSLAVYNIAGQLVSTLVNEEKPAGKYSVQWNGKDSDEKELSSGMYYCRLTAGKVTRTTKLMLMKE